MDEHYPAPVFAQDDVPNVYEPALLDGPADSEELLRWQSG
jgi:hypothetical protein